MKPIEPAISGHKVVSDPSLPGAVPVLTVPGAAGAKAISWQSIS